MASQRRASVLSKVGTTIMVSMFGVSCTAPIANWPASYDSNTGARFIPIELWTGAEWDGKRVITMSKADIEFGRANEKNIIGPFEWTHPKTGENLLVYERNNAGKRQLFTVTNDGTGLGRVYDSRYDRDCVNEVKFPLGYWRQCETRVYEVKCNGFKKPRPLKVTIKDLVWLGLPFALLITFSAVLLGGMSAY
jgi:hypothetical protein